jgi:hypothetical protein
MNKLETAIHALKTESTFQLMGDMTLFTDALTEIDGRLTALETKKKANKT